MKQSRTNQPIEEDAIMDGFSELLNVVPYESSRTNHWISCESALPGDLWCVSRYRWKMSFACWEVHFTLLSRSLSLGNNLKKNRVFE